MSASNYKTKNISDVDSNDSKVALVGNVIVSVSGSFVLDDGTGKVEIFSDKKLDKNKLVRVFCSISDEKLTADIIQDLEGFDMNLFKKVKGLYNSAGV